MDRMDRNLGPDYCPGGSRPLHHPGAHEYDSRDYGHDYDEGRSLGHFHHRKRQQVVHRVQVSPDGVDNNTRTGSSPVRRLKRKDEDDRPPRVERELSDAYIDEITRTPRCEYGRHNTYDDMITEMNPDDPFKGDYMPSGKTKNPSPLPKSKRKKKVKAGDEDAIPLDSVSSRRNSKKKKCKKGMKSAESTGTYTVEAHVNAAFEGMPKSVPKRKTEATEQDRASVTSNGTYTIGEGKTSTQLASIRKPLWKRSPKKVKSMSQEQHTFKSDQIDQDDLVEFVKKNDIWQRECKVYIRKQKTESNCLCGRTKDWHDAKGITTSDPQEYEERCVWHHKTHSKATHTDSFGVIQFQGFGQESSESPYIRLCPTTDLKLVWTLLTEHWRLPLPNLLISVTGGAQRFDLNPRLKAVFKRGLINAATTTGAWIITGGTATGVMKIVGEAVRDHMITLGSNDKSVVALGIASWGCVANRAALYGDEGEQGVFNAQYSQEDLQVTAKGKDVPLDHNHTHFIMVDDGTEGIFGKEIEFRAQLERYLSEKVAESLSVNVTVVMLVVEGGVNTMKTVCEAIHQNIPVLVLNGSGRAADFIAFGYKISKDITNEDKSKFPSGFTEDMKNVAKEKFAWKATDNVDKKVGECVKQLKDTLKKRGLVNIFNLSEADTKDMDRAILYALLKANKTNANAQLSLAMVWNRCDIARHEIFTQDNRKYWKNISLYDAMFTALVQDRTDFVQLFMENGVSLKKFLSIETLWNLYANVLQDSSDSTAQLINNLLMYLSQNWTAYLCCQKTKNYDIDPDLLLTVGKCIVHLLGDEAMNPYQEDKFRVETKSPDLKWLAGNHDSKPGETSRGVSGQSSKRKRTCYDFDKFPERELFYWAILFNRKDLAKMFWKGGQDQLGAALVGCSLLKEMSKVADDDGELELSSDLEEHANLYEEMATGVLSEGYKRDKQMAHQLLVRRLEHFGKTTLFTLADTNMLMIFMGHTCCQTKLNLIWKGRMALCTQTWKILMSLLLFFCISSIKFTTNTTAQVNPEDDCDFDELKVPKEESQDKDDAPKKKLYIRTNSIDVLSAFYFFYTAPVTVFIANTIAYLVFLGLFTYFMLTNFYPEVPSVYEYIIWGWTVIMFIEEIRQIFNRDQRSLWYKVRNWFGSMWNRFDLAMYVIFIVSVVLRFQLRGESFVYARIFYSVTLSMYYMRFMQTFFAEKNIGPKVIMIRNMIIDLVFFFFIFALFLLSFGVAYQANLYPNSPPSWYLLKSVVYIPYWQMYGELFLENMEGEQPLGCTSNETIWRASGGVDRCPEENALVPLLAAVYLILTNILLVNLLIAMFSYTFQMVQDRSEQVWRFYRYSLVYEFYDRPMLCGPFIIISHIYRCIKWITRKTCSTKKYYNEFKLNLDDKDNNRLTLFERSATENYLNISHKLAREELNNKVADTADRIENVIEELDSIKERMSHRPQEEEGPLETARPDSVPPLTSRRSELDANMEVFQARLADLGDQVAKMMQMMQTIMMQQRSRPSHLEIWYMLPVSDAENK